jgi:hypothetical protein
MTAKGGADPLSCFLANDFMLHVASRTDKNDGGSRFR